MMMECPKCNYPNMDGVENCNDCGYDLKKQNLLDKPLITKTKESAINLNPSNTQKVGTSSTPNIRMTESIIEDFNNSNLTTTISDKDYNIPASSGKTILQPVSLGSEIDYSPILFDEEIVINRSIIDKNDFSISSGEHAKIYKSDEEWFLENNASNSAVFLKIKAASKIKIEHGDIILFGSKKFFEFQNNAEEE